MTRFANFFLVLCSLSSIAQCPNASFVLDLDGCIDQLIAPENNSTGATDYQWDFCDNDDLIQIPNTDEVLAGNSFGGTFDHVIVESFGSYYGFVPTRADNSIIRLDFGDSIGNSPIYNDLGSLGGTLSDPTGIDIIYDGSNWYGLLTSFANNTIQLLSFGSSITNTPEVQNITGSLSLVNPVKAKFLLQSGDYFGLIENYSNPKLDVLSFGSLISPTYTSREENVTGASILSDMKTIKQCDEWFTFLVSRNTQEIYRLAWGTDLSNSPAINEIASGIGFTLNDPLGLAIGLSGGNYVIFVTSRNGPLYRMDLGSDILNIPTGIDLGNLNGSSRDYDLELVKDESTWYLVGGNFIGDIFRYTFPNICSSSVETSSISNPSINFQTSGTNKITLKATDENENIDIDVKTLTITSDIAPSISFTPSSSRCISSSNFFTPSNPDLTSYSWDFNNDGVEDSNLENPSFDYSSLGSGTYTVRLDVSDGTCDNFFEQEITIYDPPPVPNYTFSAPRTCINTDYTFSNTTSDGAYTGPLEYLWEFINEPSGTVVSTATTRDAVYAFETAGQKTVRLTSSIPGCSEVIEQSLMITSGPSSAFTSTSVCQGETMQFTNNSLDATSYSWDFGDGFMSSSENPSHVYIDAGNYFVTLIATDAEGCNDTEVIEVAVSDSPQISFDFDVPCTSSEGIQFTDLTTVDNADVVSWNWSVDGVEVSTSQNPIINFNSGGIRTIRLDVQGSNGCESSYFEDIEILTAPTPDFSSSIACQGEESSFTDITVSGGNPIVSWLWTVDGVTYVTQDVVHTFENPGTYDISLEVTGQNFCSEIIMRTVEIIGLPTINFSINGECDNQLIQVADESTETLDSIVSRRWLLNGQNVGNGEQLFLESLANNSYDLELEVETSSGCIVSGTQLLEINTAPESSFTSSRTYGIPNDALSFTNTSTGSVSHQWFLNNEIQSSDTPVENITFPNPGMHEVSLVTENSLGCYDTARQDILIAIPEVDLSIGSFELVEENGTGRIFLEVTNSSNLPIALTEAQITLENQFSVNEQIVAFVDIGETELVSLNIGIPLAVAEPSYFCVRLFSQYVDYPDINPLDDEKCLTIQPEVRVENPFPNPITDQLGQFRIKVVLPTNGVVDLTLVNSLGKVQKRKSFDAQNGLNNFFVEMDALPPGIYYLTLNALGTLHKRKVIKL